MEFGGGDEKVKGPGVGFMCGGVGRATSVGGVGLEGGGGCRGAAPPAADGVGWYW